MSSEVDVMCRGLSKLGANRITSRLDDNKPAREMNANYDAIRDAELRRNNWRFSITRASLSALTGTPIGSQFTLKYQLPADCLKLIQVGEFYDFSLSDYRTRDESPYSLEGREILTNLPAPLFIRYVRQVTDATQFDAAFVESLAAMLAVETCKAITGSDSAKADARKDYEFAITGAIAANAIEIPSVPIADDSWLLSRICR